MYNNNNADDDDDDKTLRGTLRRLMVSVDLLSTYTTGAWVGGGVCTVLLALGLTVFSIWVAHDVATAPPVQTTVNVLESTPKDMAIRAGCAMDGDGLPDMDAVNDVYRCMVVTGKNSDIFLPTARVPDDVLRQTSPYLSTADTVLVEVDGEAGGSEEPFLTTVAMVNRTALAARRGASFAFVTQSSLVTDSSGAVVAEATAADPLLPISYVSPATLGLAHGVILARYTSRGEDLASFTRSLTGSKDEDNSTLTTWQFIPLGIRKATQCAAVVPLFVDFVGGPSAAMVLQARLAAGDTTTTDMTCVVMHYSLAGVRFESVTGPEATFTGTVGLVGGVASVVRIFCVLGNRAAHTFFSRRRHHRMKKQESSVGSATYSVEMVDP